MYSHGVRTTRQEVVPARRVHGKRQRNARLTCPASALAKTKDAV